MKLLSPDQRGTRDFAPYVLMIAMLMIRPYGIFGSWRIERV